MKRRAVKDEKQNPNFPKNPNPKPSKLDIFSSSKRVFALCLVFRMANSLMIQTYFNPDEHWQALEVAHRISFGYGHLTWEWSKGIRSYLHPMLFVVLYKLLALLHLDTPWFMVRAPRLLQSIFSSVGDFYLYKLSRRIFGQHVAKWTVSSLYGYIYICLSVCFSTYNIRHYFSGYGTSLMLLQLFSQLTNWFMFFCFPRTLSNNLEAVLTLVGLYYWPSFKDSSRHVDMANRKWGLAVAALACAIRPTSAITWLYVGLLELFEAQDRLKFIFFEAAPIGVLVLALTCLLDWSVYGSWIFVPLNFLKFNFLSSGGDYYGTHKWHWYYSQGFPVMLFTFLPFSTVGIFQSKQWKLSGLMSWVLGLYSVLGHKEFRFVFPVLPIALMFAGYSLARLDSPSSSDSKQERALGARNKCPSKVQLAILFLLATNIPMALYMSLVHQRGSEDVMMFLSKEALNNEVKSILFLMPCHATPYYSTLHRDLPMRFLDCTPSDEKGVIDESDRFMMDPVEFMSDMVKDWSLPSHIVLFDSQERLLKELLTSKSFGEMKRFFHAHFKVDRDLQASVVVYCLMVK